MLCCNGDIVRFNGSAFDICPHFSCDFFHSSCFIAGYVICSLQELSLNLCNLYVFFHELFLPCNPPHFSPCREIVLFFSYVPDSQSIVDIIGWFIVDKCAVDTIIYIFCQIVSSDICAIANIALVYL